MEIHQGFLNPTIIPHANLTKSLIAIRNNLQTTHLHLMMVTDIDFYYSTFQSMLTFRHKDFIVDTVQIPVLKQNTHFTMSTHFPSQPLHFQNMPPSSMICQIILISTHSQHYTSIDHVEFQLCTQYGIYLCTFQPKMRPLSAESCISALYFQNTDGIHKLWQFTFLPHYITPSLSRLPDEYIYAQNISRIKL